jgi:hypothetical protein
MEINRKQFLSLREVVHDLFEFVAERARLEGLSPEDAARLSALGDRLVNLHMNALGDWSADIEMRKAVAVFERNPPAGNA